MAKPHLNTPLLLFFFVILLLESSTFSSAARFRISDVHSAEPALNLVLPGVGDVVSTELQAVKTSPEEDSPARSAAGERYLPCGSAISGNRKVGVMGFRALRLCGKGSQLLLSMLPKGRVPPSGPSRGTNYENIDDNNGDNIDDNN